MNFTHRTGLLLVLVFIVSLPAVTPRIYAADEVEYFSFLRSLWFDHDLSFDNEYRHFYEAIKPRMPGFRETFLDDTTPTGRRKNFGTIGCALLWAPFYAVADAGVRIARLAGANVTADGYSWPYLAAVAYGSAVYGFLALLLSAYACRLLFGHAERFGSPGPANGFAQSRRDGRLGQVERAGAAHVARCSSAATTDEAQVVRGTRDRGAGAGRSIWFATLAVWVGTPLLFYMYVTPPFSHAASAFAVAAFIVTWLRVRRSWSPRGMAALGALAALMTMVREQDVLIAGGVALDLAWTVVSRAREGTDVRAIARLIGNAVIGTAVAVLAYLPQAIAYVVLNGHLGPSRLVTRKMTWTSPHAWQVLASPEHGFLVWTPLAGLAIAGLVVMAFRGRARVAICLLVMLALQVYVAGAIESWTVAGAFGQRRFIGLTLVLVVGLAALAESARARALRRLALTAVILAAWWNVALIVQFGTGLMDRQRLTLGANAYNAFVVVPREIPRIAYRYAFDRTSFYAAPTH